jgi:membrane-associated phospholipid phosphatase
MPFTRRAISAGLLSLVGTRFDGQSKAQTLTDEQKRSLASIFAAAPPPAAASELNELLQLQESMTNVVPDMDNVTAFITKRPLVQAVTQGLLPVLGKLYAWHQLSLEATALDHTTYSSANPPPTFGEQLGPPRSSRALAIVHVAMYEAANTITQKAQSYKGIQSDIFKAIGLTPADVSQDTASIDMAIMQAAFDTLSVLYPKKEPMFKATYDLLYVTIPDSPSKMLGQKIGAAAAAGILSGRMGDHADPGEPPAPSYDPAQPLKWSADLIAPGGPPPIALGGNWGKVIPFVMQSSSQFRPSKPPVLGEANFASGYQEVHDIGGDPDVTTGSPRWSTPTKRKGTLNDPLDDSNETFKAIFWAYDGTPALCAPPRLYNMIATSIALREMQITSVDEFARFLALVNIALADAGIGAWEAKYYYSYARPITVMRNINPSGAQGKGDPHWTPLGAQVTNGGASSRNLTPPFPAYPSGHAVFGAALFAVMQKYWSAPDSGFPFHFVSDEFNGNNRGPGESKPRPFVNRPFASFTDADTENAQSRIWMGIHWPWDRDEGIKQGKAIGEYVVANVLNKL